jgi:hypothetical protein
MAMAWRVLSSGGMPHHSSAGRQAPARFRQTHLLHAFPAREAQAVPAALARIVEGVIAFGIGLAAVEGPMRRVPADVAEEGLLGIALLETLDEIIGVGIGGQEIIAEIVEGLIIQHEMLVAGHARLGVPWL